MAQSGTTMTINSVTVSESDYTTTVSVDEPLAGTFNAVLQQASLAAENSFGTYQLCHLKSSKLSSSEDDSATVTITNQQCFVYPVLYTIELSIALPDGMKSTVEQFIQGSAYQIYVLTGYTTSFVTSSDDKTVTSASASSTYSFILNEQQRGLFGSLTCSSFTSESGQQSELSCFIKAISSNVTSEHHCKDLNLCPPAVVTSSDSTSSEGGQPGVTFTFKFSEAVSQQAIRSELATLVDEVTKMTGGSLSISLNSVKFADDSKSVDITIAGIPESYIGVILTSIGSYM